MNIFITDPDPVISATDLCDKHVPKMLLESAQMLNNAIITYKGTNPIYRQLMINHPCSKWTIKSRENYEWLLDHAYEINNQFEKRFLKPHKSKAVLDICKYQYKSWAWDQVALTPFAQAMPIIYRNIDPVLAYRSYIKGEKVFAKWNKGTPKPSWYDDHVIEYDRNGILDYIKRGLPVPISLT